MTLRIEQPTRRGFLTGLGSLFVAAPAIVRVASIMPVKVVENFVDIELDLEHDLILKITDNLYGDLVSVTRKAFLPRLFVQIYESNGLLRCVAVDPFLDGDA